MLFVSNVLKNSRVLAIGRACSEISVYWCKLRFCLYMPTSFYVSIQLLTNGSHGLGLSGALFACTIVLE